MHSDRLLLTLFFSFFLILNVIKAHYRKTKKFTKVGVQAPGSPPAADGARGLFPDFCGSFMVGVFAPQDFVSSTRVCSLGADPVSFRRESAVSVKAAPLPGGHGASPSSLRLL